MRSLLILITLIVVSNAGIILDIVCDCEYARPIEKYAVGDKVDLGIGRRRSLVRYFTYQNDTHAILDPFVFTPGCNLVPTDKDHYYVFIEFGYVKPGSLASYDGKKETIIGASIGTAIFLLCVCVCAIFAIKYFCCHKSGLANTTKNAVEQTGKTRMQLMMSRNV